MLCKTILPVDWNNVIFYPSYKIYQEIIWRVTGMWFSSCIQKFATFKDIIIGPKDNDNSNDEKKVNDKTYDTRQRSSGG